MAKGKEDETIIMWDKRAKRDAKDKTKTMHTVVICINTNVYAHFLVYYI